MSDVDYEREPLQLATGAAHRVKLPPRVLRGRLTGFLFETNKTFLLPKALTGIRGVAEFYAAHPGMKVLVTGHTDTVGPESNNLLLSDERADAVAAFLIDDVDAWLRHYQGTPGSSRWGNREDQHMLSALPAGQPPYYAGPITNVADAATQDAIRRFQADHGLVTDGVAGPITRRALITDYMATDGTSLPPGTEMQTHGCGEYHNEVPTPDETEEQGNRRVEVFFFEGPIEPPPRGTCPSPGCPEYPEWLRRTVLTVDFSQELTDVLVEVLGTKEGVTSPLADADVSLVREGVTMRTLPSDSAGRAWFRELTAGHYTVRGRKPDYLPAVADVVVPVSDDVERSEPVQRANFAQDEHTGAGGNAGGGSQPVVLQLQSILLRVRWLDEEGITKDAKEENTTWKHARVFMRGNAGGGTQVVTDDDHDGIFKLSREGATKGFVENAKLFDVHATAVDLRMRDGKELEVLPDQLLDLKVSSRLRQSVWAFYAPFSSGLIGKEDIKLDDGHMDLFRDAQIDDLSLVSTISWVEKGPDGDDNPEVDWWDFAPAGEIVNDSKLPNYRRTYNRPRAANYMRKLCEAMHARGRQVQAGWASVDVRSSSLTYNRGWTAFLKRATTAQIDLLASRALDFFFSQGIDIDGLGYDFEINSLGEDQAANLARLYQTTARLLREKKADGFVSYANAPFSKDGDHTYSFMKVQPFALARDTPNLLARPMCFDDKNSVPVGTINAGISCAIRKTTDNQGGGLHPAHSQFGLWADKLVSSGEWSSVVDTCRRNRTGIILYQLPKPGADLASFFKKAADWNKLLNPGEADAGVDGQPLQVALRRQKFF